MMQVNFIFRSLICWITVRAVHSNTGDDGIISSHSISYLGWHWISLQLSTFSYGISRDIAYFSWIHRVFSLFLY